MKKIFYGFFLIIFGLLLGTQGYFALHDTAAKEMRAERIGAEFVDRSALVGDEIGGMSLYLTVETDARESSRGVLCINNTEVGSLERGVLTVQVEEGDILTIKDALGETVSVMDYPDDLDDMFLPKTIYCAENMMKWGKISFR